MENQSETKLKKNYRIRICLSHDELDRIIQSASLLSLSLSAYCRMAALSRVYSVNTNENNPEEFERGVKNGNRNRNCKNQKENQD